MKLKDPSKIDRIFEATLDIVAEKGLAGLNMSLLGKTSNLGMGTIYTYFKSKEEIINKLYLKIRRENYSFVFEKMQEEVGFENKFRKLYFAWFKNRWTKVKRYHFLDQVYFSPYLTQHSIDEFNILLNQIDGVIAEGIEEGIVVDIRPALLRNYLTGGTKEVIVRSRARNIPLTDELMEICYQQTMKLIAK